MGPDTTAELWDRAERWKHIWLRFSWSERVEDPFCGGRNGTDGSRPRRLLVMDCYRAVDVPSTKAARRATVGTTVWSLPL
jgi:hypothetical protein